MKDGNATRAAFGPPAKTEAAFISYFEAGNTPSEAKQYHQKVLQSQSDFNVAITLADSSVNPKDHVIHYLYRKWRKEIQGERSGANMIKKLIEKMEELQGEGVKITMIEEPFCIAIVTPIANRTHKHHPMSKYIAFVDSTSSCGLDSNCVTFLFTASAAGALPLGVVITKSQGQHAYATGFKLLRQLLGDQAFGGQGFPSVFMTDDSNAERGGLHEAWPEACQLLCQFHGANAMWKWLWLGTHQINNKDRQPLVQMLTVGGGTAISESLLSSTMTLGSLLTGSLSSTGKNNLSRQGYSISPNLAHFKSRSCSSLNDLDIIRFCTPAL